MLNTLRMVLVSAVVVFTVSVSSAQDRDITSGSSSGSIRPDVLDTHSGPRTRMLTPSKRGELVAEFDSLRGAETLLGATNFDAVKEDYKLKLEKFAAEKPVATDLTPLKYFVFKLMATNLAANKTDITAEEFASSLMSSYVKTKSFMAPLSAAGITRSEAKRAEQNAVAELKRFKKK